MTGDRILATAREVFGFTSLRAGQREAVANVLDGRDTLAVLATGAGKSAIYALAGQLLRRPTVVVSPLIALENDQLAGLQERGNLSAVVINSAEGDRARRQALDQLAERADRPTFVFLAPEQLANADVLHRLAELRPGLVAVDEAHLISQWGTDFRPDYLRIGPAVQALGRPVVLALTATAAPQVRNEIVDRLAMRDPAVLVGGFARANIDLSVHSYFMDEAHKLEVIVNDVQDAARHQGHGIVYGASHKRVEHLAAECARVGVRAAPYHAGLSAAARRETEQRFRGGDLDVVVATIAFGMGIDKPDIRWVFHADVSGSVDEYYQEIGRAGRDGQHADAVLYFRREDLQLPRWFAAQSGPSGGSLAKVAKALGRQDRPDNLDDIRRRTGLSRNRVSATVLALADAGGVVVDADGHVTVIGDLDQALTTAKALIQHRRAIARSHSETMEVYAGDLGCRWRFLLEYFGEEAPERCGHCDNDHRHRATQDGDDAGRPFPRGSRVVHPVFGEADVVGYVGSWILLAFDRAGYKRLELDVVEERGLLSPA